jgi:hypothetical protein
MLLAACGASGGDNLERMVLPAGDAEAGRKAFIDLQCTSCHQFSGVEGLPRPAEGVDDTPDLGSSLAGQNRGQIASSVIAPAHVDSRRVELWTDWTDSQRVWVGPGGARPPRDSEPPAEMLRMKDYRGSMTVQQLCDIVEFLHKSSR